MNIFKIVYNKLRHKEEDLPPITFTKNNVIVNGTFVKINADAIKGRSLTPKFLDWVEKHKDDIFVAENYKNNAFFTLKEDNSETKWIFYKDDLINVE